jgi:hypothetical protein
LEYDKDDELNDVTALRRQAARARIEEQEQEFEASHANEHGFGDQGGGPHIQVPPFTGAHEFRGQAPRFTSANRSQQQMTVALLHHRQIPADADHRRHHISDSAAFGRNQVPQAGQHVPGPTTTTLLAGYAQGERRMPSQIHPAGLEVRILRLFVDDKG